MQSLQDIKRRVQLEVDHFNYNHASDPYREGYLWYVPTSAERDGGIVVMQHCPAAPGSVEDGLWTLVCGENVRNYSGEGMAQKLTVLDVLSRLPVLARD